MYKIDDDELMHYGVLGMKWGVHKARRFIKKRPSYERKSDKAEYKSSVHEYKYAKTESPKHYQKMKKYKHTHAKLEYKIKKGIQYVTKTLHKIDDITPEDLNNGYEFCKDFRDEVLNDKDLREAYT